MGGGKGGVGKSLVSGNVAIGLAHAGRRVVLVDADLGAANQHTLFGVDRALGSLRALFANEASSLDEIASPTQVPNLRLVAGTAAIAGAANISHAQKQKLLRHLRRVEADVVVVDVGAGTSHNVVDIFDVGDARLLVVTPQITSIQNAYAFLKAAVLRLFRHTAEDAGQIELLERAIGVRETERVDQILGRLEQENPIFAARLRETVGTFDTRLVGNMVTEGQEVGMFRGVTRMVRDFLGVPLTIAAHLRHSRLIHQSVNLRRPFLTSGAEDEDARALRRLAAAVLRPPSAAAFGPRPTPAWRPVDRRGPENPEDVLRQSARFAVSWMAALERDGQRATARVVDVSERGVGVETAQPLTEGELWTVELLEPNLRVRFGAVVRHVGSARHAGLAFEAAPEICAQIVSAARRPLSSDG